MKTKKNEFERYVNIYDIEKKGSDIEPIIMEALSKRESNELDTLKLAVKWNQVEKVKELLQRSKVNFL